MSTSSSTYLLAGQMSNWSASNCKLWEPARRALLDRVHAFECRAGMRHAASLTGGSPAGGSPRSRSTPRRRHHSARAIATSARRASR